MEKRRVADENEEETMRDEAVMTKARRKAKIAKKLSGLTSSNVFSSTFHPRQDLNKNQHPPPGMPVDGFFSIIHHQR